MNTIKDLTGKQFGRLTVVEYSKEKRLWLCKCICNNYIYTRSYSLTSGHTKSCGCYHNEIASKNISNSNYLRGTHHKKNTRLYRIWSCMKQRCYNRNHHAFKNYGGRGIVICEEWKDNFQTFYDWAINNGYNDKLTIDRINNNGNYEPSNCRWITLKEQSLNRQTTRYIAYKGMTKSLAEWSDDLEINYHTLFNRLYTLRWDIEKSFTTQVKKAKGD